ncbi:hypothetical protein C7C46_17730 [Streptomyces tateyamensis]|uniref:Uncharacterized protein n=1 Tax=Streptomyces tateyamensis TaxID=565073 RepID=A0A2V4N4K8_9ACTN|nr:hypothetical protein [Streptomyces tateyamensis]PYC77813.1 hypothetical protein C7C46_17730 [Streptomyces tateyamensis]
MHSRWTTVLLTTALGGVIATGTGIAAGGATPDQPTAVRPAVAMPDAAKTLDVTGKLGAVLAKVNELAAASSPAGGAAADPAALKAKLADLGTASDQLKAALPPAAPLPAVPGTLPAPGVSGAPSGAAVPSLPGAPSGAAVPSLPGAPSGAAVPSLPGAPSVPAAGGPGAVPVQVLSGGPLQRGLPTLPVSVEDTLGAMQKDAAALVAAASPSASAKQPDPAAVRSAAGPLAADNLGLLTAVAARLTG